MATKYELFIEKKRSQYGEKFNDSGLNPDFIEYFNSNEQIQVGFGNGCIKIGYVNVTTGRSPVFTLTEKLNGESSIDLIDGNCVVLAEGENIKFPTKCEFCGQEIDSTFGMHICSNQNIRACIACMKLSVETRVINDLNYCPECYDKEIIKQ
jgi:hypothetical protein